MLKKPSSLINILPLIAFGVGFASLGILFFTSSPPPEGVRSLYKIRLRLSGVLVVLVLLSFLYFIGDTLYFLFKKQWLQSFVGFFGIFILGCGLFSTRFLLATGVGFSELASLKIQDASYRLIRIGDPDGFPSHYALCECDGSATRCTCYLIHTQVYGEAVPTLSLDRANMEISASFEDGLICQYPIPLSFDGPLSSYNDYAFFECR